MTNHQPLIDKFTQEAHDCLAQACKLYPEFAQAMTPEIRWDLKSGRVLGTASHHAESGHSLLRFNVLAASLDPQGYSKVVKHEVAHIVAMVCFEDFGHGAAWKRVCKALGGDPKRLCEGNFDDLPTAYPQRRVRYFGWINFRGDICYFEKRIHERLIVYPMYRRGYKVRSFAEERLMTKADHKAYQRSLTTLARTAR